jgi:hypothetical protein
MPFVQRDLSSRVIGCYAQLQSGIAEQFLADDHPDVLAFFAPKTQDERAAMAVDAKERLAFEIDYDQESRLRVIEGKVPITKAQYRDALIARWKTLNQ